MRLKKKANGLRKVNATLLMFLLTTVPAFAEEKITLLDRFREGTGGYYDLMVGVFISADILVTAVTLIINKKDPQKRQEILDGILYAGIGFGMLAFGPHIMSLFGY